MVYTSKKLMEVEVIIDVEIAADQNISHRRAAIGYFIVTSVNESGRLLNVPALKVKYRIRTVLLLIFCLMLQL